MRLLLIEDEPTLRESVAKKLRRSGYETDDCGDGEAALDLLAAERYDLVLLDLNLPKVDGMTGSLVLFSILLLLISVATKIVGCGLGAKLCHFTGKESLQVGVGMVCRGEVALIVANRGLELGVLSGTLMAPVIITVVGGTILTPILLKLVFRHDGQPASAADSNLADHYEKMEQLDIVSAELLARDQKYLKEGEHGGDKDRG